MHADGQRHMKSHSDMVLSPSRLQPLTDAFWGTEHAVAFSGFALKSVGAICNPVNFSKVVEVQSGVLGPRDGGITVDLVEPGHDSGTLPLDQNLVAGGDLRQTTVRRYHNRIVFLARRNSR